MNLTNHLRRGLVAVAAAASAVGGVGGIARADNVAAATPLTVTAATATTDAPADGVLNAVTAPRAPRSPTATPRNTAVRLTWLRPSSNGGATINKYRVQRATTKSGPWKTIAKPTVLRYRATGLKNGQRYYFRIAADNAAGWSTPSKVVSAVPRTVPAPPRSPTATPGNAAVNLTWATPASNGGAKVDKYRLQRSVAGGTWKTIAWPTTRSHTAGGLTNGKRYYFRVAAQNPAGWGPYSTVVNAVPSTAPSAPRSLLAESMDASVHLSWLPPSSTGGAVIDKYEVTRSTDQVNWTSSPPLAKHGMDYGGLTNGVTYYFQVRAHNASGWGPWTSAVSVVPYTVPSGPVGAWSFYSSITNTVDLFWSPPANNGGANVDHYWVAYSYDQTSWFQWSATSETHVSFGVGPQLPDYWRVTAHNAAGYGPPSNVVTLNVP